jgi:hypothetical protein
VVDAEREGLDPLIVNRYDRFAWPLRRLVDAMEPFRALAPFRRSGIRPGPLSCA